jgi:hypothetical protein
MSSVHEGVRETDIFVFEIIEWISINFLVRIVQNVPQSFIWLMLDIGLLQLKLCC